MIMAESLVCQSPAAIFFAVLTSPKPSMAGPSLHYMHSAQHMQQQGMESLIMITGLLNPMLEI
jgi:hypothetical protein